MRFNFAWLLLGFGLAAAPLLAHHSFAAEFDEKKPVTLKGSVSRLDWTNPHVYVYLDAAGPDGQIATWAVELESPAELRKNGWSRDSLKAGDSITVEASLARDGSKLAAAKNVLLANGKRLNAPQIAAITAAPRSSQAAKPAPKWPGGHVRLGPEPGQTGYWTSPSAASLIETSAGNIRMNSQGLLANIGDAAKIAPFQPWAKGLYEYRQRTLLKDDPMASCLPPGGPRQFQIPNGVQFLEQPDRQRIFIMSGGGNRNWRLVYLDGRALPQGEDVTPTYYGYSAGKWDGDTLVLNTAGFNERFWFSNGGLPHTEALKLTERISRPDFDTLKYEVTIDDPGAYTRPWSGGWTLKWAAGEDIQEYFCDDSNRDPAHLRGN